MPRTILTDQLAVDSNGNHNQFLIHDDTTHDVKVAPALVDSIDLKDTDVFVQIKDMTQSS